MAPSARSVACPRCGYDQQGVIDSWAEACPLQSLCSECGLYLEWRVLYAPERFVPSWSIEMGRLSLSRISHAMLLSLNPWLLWRRIDLTHAFRGDRLLVLAFAWMVSAFLLLQVLLFGLARDWYRIDFWTSGLGRPGMWACVHSTDRLLVPPVPCTESAHWPVFLLLWAAVIPLCFRFLPRTLAKARVRREHLWRIAAYSIGGTLITNLALVAASLVVLLSVRSYYDPFGRPCFWVTPLAALLSWYGALALAGLWLIAFWTVAIRRYLRLPHAFAVALLLAIMAGIVAFAIAAFFPGSNLIWDTI